MQSPFQEIAMFWVITFSVMAVTLFALIMMLYGIAAEKYNLILYGCAIITVAMFLYTIYEPKF